MKRPWRGKLTTPVLLVVAVSLTYGLTTIGRSAAGTDRGANAAHTAPLRLPSSDVRPLHRIVPLNADAVTAAALDFPALAAHRQADAALRQAQAAANAHPRDLAALDALAGALLARADRAGGLPNMVQADTIIRHALATDADDYAAVSYEALLRLAQHRDASAASLAGRMVRSAPDQPVGYAALGLADLALGDDVQASAALARFAALQPGPAAEVTAAAEHWARGEQQGAFQYLRMAIAAVPATSPLNAALAALLGDRYLAGGSLVAAASQYQVALASDPHSAAGLAGLGAVRAAAGATAAGIDLYRRAVAQASLPSYQEALADLYGLSGQRVPAATALAAARAAYAAEAAAGIDIALDRARFNADQGLGNSADVAAARAALTARHDAETEDAAAWVLSGAGLNAEALHAEDQALAHGAKDALRDFHEGMILARIGHAQEALSFLHEAVMISPAFGPRQVDTAYGEMRRLSALHTAN